MPIQISLKKSTTDPTGSSGLTLGEPVFNYSNNTFWMGLGGSTAPVWIGAGICGASAAIASGNAYLLPSAGAVRDYFIGVSGSFLPSSTGFVASFNGLTGAVQGVESVNGANGAVINVAVTNADNSFSTSQSIYAPNALLTVEDANTANNIALDSTLNRISSYNDGTSATVVLQFPTNSSRTITLPNATTTLAGLAVAQTYTALQTFNSGITTAYIYSSTGSTFASTLQVSGGATFGSTVDVSGVARFASGVTFSTTTDHTGVARFAAGITTSTLDTTGAARFASTTTTTGLATFSGGISASGGTFSSQLNAQNLKMLTVGGDEGGQIDFGLAATNTTLSGNVAIDVYQNKLRFFETGGSARGAYIDLTAASAGAATDILSVVTTVNGYTGAVGGLPPSFGTTGGSAIRAITYPDGVTTQRADRSQYFFSFTRVYQSSGSMAVYANRTYFQPQSVSKSTTLKSLRFTSANTGITGNCYFSVWSADPNSGNPSTRLYASASTVVGSGYNNTTVTNASGLVTVPAGNWWLAVSFSSTPTIYTQHKDYIIPYAGAPDFNSGYKNYYPVVDTNGFTAPSAITGTGITYAWVEYHPNTYITPHFEWQPT